MELMSLSNEKTFKLNQDQEHLFMVRSVSEIIKQTVHNTNIF